MDRLLEATARAERDHFWFRGLRKFVEPLIADAAQARPLRILDYGCGTGHNLTLLRRYGCASGIDLAWAGLRYERTRGERRLPPAPINAALAALLSIEAAALRVTNMPVGSSLLACASRPDLPPSREAARRDSP